MGSDGILALAPSQKADFGLKIYNPDGSEAEKVGQWLRIFARYLHATGQVQKQQFTVETEGGLVSIDLHIDHHGDASTATVEMGRATFAPAALPCTLEAEELVAQPIDVNGLYLDLYRRQRRQPPLHRLSREGRAMDRGRAVLFGPEAGKSPALPPAHQRATRRARGAPRDLHPDLGARRWDKRRRRGRRRVRPRVRRCGWGLVKSPVAVRAPGGTLHIDVSASYDLTMKGPVSEVARGAFSPSFVRHMH